MFTTQPRQKQSLQSLRCMWAFRKGAQHLVEDTTAAEMTCREPAAGLAHQSSSNLLQHRSRRQGYSKSLPEQISFFEIQFDSQLEEYIIQGQREDNPQWLDLRSVSAFTRNHQVFRCGDYVMIAVLKTGKGQRGGANIACINEIRPLPRPDTRKLVLITWLYYYRGRYYESNHLQIVLWDTIAGRATVDQVRKIRKSRIYNACGGRRICDEKQSRVWRKRKQRITGCKA